MDQQSSLDDLNSKLDNLKNDPNTVTNTGSDIQNTIKILENKIKGAASELSKTKNQYNNANASEQTTRGKINDMKNDQNINNKPTLESLGIPDYVPIQKLKYDEDEIIKLIKWVIEMNYKLSNNSNIG